MARQVNIHDAKTRLSALLIEVEAGEEIIIARANKPVARLVPYQPHTIRKLGEAKGQVKINPGFDELPEDFMAYFR